MSATGAAPAAAWQLTLEITERGGSPQIQVLRRDEISIGRVEEGNDLVLASCNVSRRHCRIVVRPDGTALAIDGSSTNGTFLNGLLVQEPTPMHPGDKLYVGDFVIALAREPERAA